MALQAQPPHRRTVVVAHPEFVATSALHPALVRDDAFTVRASLGLVCGATDDGGGATAALPLADRDVRAGVPCCHAVAPRVPADPPHGVKLAQPGEPDGSAPEWQLPWPPCSGAASCAGWLQGAGGCAAVMPGGACAVPRGTHSGCNAARSYGGGFAMGAHWGCWPETAGRWPVTLMPAARFGGPVCAGGPGPMGACMAQGSVGVPPGTVAWVPVQARWPPASWPPAVRPGGNGEKVESRRQRQHGE